MTVMQPGYGLHTKHKMSTRLDIAGSTMYRNFQTWLNLQAQPKDLYR